MRPRVGLSLLWMIVVVACAPPANDAETELREAQFQSLVGVREFGTHFRMTKDPESEELKAGAQVSVVFEIENTSERNLVFQNDLGLMLLAYDEVSKQWIEVNDLMDVEPGPEIMLSADGEPWQKTEEERIRPDLTAMSTARLLRIVVRGRIATTGEPIANYLEYTVAP
jgi:hypothetical protein